jgi:hypothetical protein
VGIMAQAFHTVSHPSVYWFQLELNVMENGSTVHSKLGISIS